MLKPLLLGLIASFALSTTLTAQSYLAQLTGHQEVPSTSTLAEGFFFAQLDGDSLRVTGAVGTLSTLLFIPPGATTAAHIHTGFTGQNGPITLELNIDFDPVANSASFTTQAYFVGDRPDLIAAMNEGRAYVNVHTGLWPAGEVRGQIVLIDNLNTAYDAMLYGDQENPPVTTDGIGGALIEVTDTEIIVSGSFSLESPIANSSGTGAHLHTGFVGENGPVVIPLTPTMDPGNVSGVFAKADNTFPIDQNMIDAMEERRMYVNVHSIDHPAGELRGQVVGAANNVYFTYISNIAPQPFPDPAAVQRMMVEKVYGEDTIKVSGSFQNLPANLVALTAPFLRVRDPFNGRGIVAFDLPFTTDATGGSGTIPVASFGATADARNGLFRRYFSGGGFALPNGADFLIAGGLYHECKRLFHSTLTASQTVPNAISRGSGSLLTEYYTDRLEVTGVVSGLSGILDTGAQGGLNLHEGMIGRTGDAVLPISYFQASTFAAIIPTSNIIRLTSDQAARMRDRGFYYNANTPDYPMGEVRGQLVPRSNTMFHSIITSGQTVPSTGPAPANGAILAEVYADQMQISGTFNDVVGGFNPNIAGGAHLHGNIAGRTGGIMIGLTSLAPMGAEEGEFFASDNTFDISADLIDSMINRQVYVNIHSVERPSGELRGQLTPLAPSYVHTKLTPDVTVPYTGVPGISNGRGHLHGEIYGTRLYMSGALDSLNSSIDVSIAGGAHLHDGTVGVTGPILFPLAFNLENNGTSATFSIDSPAIVLDSFPGTSVANSLRLLNGNLYANIHTVNEPSGAVRGQMLMSGNQYPAASAGFDTPADGSTLDLNSGDSTTVAMVDWDDSFDPDDEQDVAYSWQLFTDTTAAPVFQTEVDDTSGVSFTFGELDRMLEALGVENGQAITAFHRAITTDGSLLTPSEFSEVMLVRVMNVGSNELPTGAVRLVNTLTRAGNQLLLDVVGLEAGQFSYRVANLTGQTLTQQTLAHSGSAQRYTLSDAPQQVGMYVLEVRDAQGRSSSWVFAVN